MKLTKYPLWYPNRHCTRCDVGWDRGLGEKCWMCGNESHVVPVRTPTGVQDTTTDG